MRADDPRIKHGHACVATKGGKSPTYVSWIAMRQRCLDRNCHQWPHYGGRGVTICERWSSFATFLTDMGERPAWATGGLDRIDPEGNYEPGNCRWATRSEQQRNKRRRTHCGRGHLMDPGNTYVSPGGQRQCRACNELRAATRVR